MSQQQLPYLHDLLLLNRRPTPSALCCFAGITGQPSRRRGRREPSELPSCRGGDEMSTFDDAAAADADDAVGAAAVKIYAPQSCLLGGGNFDDVVRRVRSADGSAAALTRERRSMSAMLPGGRHQQLQRHLWSSLDLPSLLSSVLGRRSGAARGAASTSGDNLARSSDQRQLVRQSACQLSAAAFDSADGDVKSEVVPVSEGNDVEAPSEAEATDDTPDDCVSESADGAADSDEDSDIVDIYVNSILETLPNLPTTNLADSPDCGAASEGVGLDDEIDIDELLMLGSEAAAPIGESTAREGEAEEALEASEAELPRAEATAEEVEVVEVAVAPAAAADASDGRGGDRRLSDTGSELAAGEFCYGCCCCWAPLRWTSQWQHYRYY